MSKSPIYLDYAATSPLRPEAMEAMRPFLTERFGNPSSIHGWGRDARSALEEARAGVAALVGARPEEVVFTSGGTEADNIAVLGVAGARQGRLLRSSIEHRAVHGPCEYLAERGRDVAEIPVHPGGVVDLDALSGLLDEAPPALVAVMWVNNETGAVQPVREVAERASSAGATVLVDAVQALGKVPVDLADCGADLAAFSAHKIGGPRGIGALYRRQGTQLEPPQRGGGQERGVRPGTVNVAGAVGFAAAARRAEAEREEEMQRLAGLRSRLESRVRAAVPDVLINAGDAPRVATISSLTFPGVDREALLVSLDLEGVAASAGSACGSGSAAVSHVIRAMGRTDAEAGPTVRLSLGWHTNEADVDRAAKTLSGVVERLRAFAAT